jgi:hypothetical protein
VISELLKSIDKGAYYAFSEMLKESPGLLWILQAGEWVGSYIGAVLLMALACVLLFAQARYRAPAIIAIGFVLAALAVEAMPRAIPVPRPDNAANRVDSGEMQRSFPARAVFTFTLAGALLVFAAWGSLPGWGARAVMLGAVAVLILWVAMSEIMLVLHFVTDVAAGLLGGLAVALFITRIVPRYLRPSGECA